MQYNQFWILIPGQPDLCVEALEEKLTAEMRDKVDGIKGARIWLTPANDDLPQQDIYPSSARRLLW
jgi:hypothetical protein